jgi:glucan phosphorylase
MSKQPRVSEPIHALLPVEVEGFELLAELALDLRWSWNHAADEVWKRLDPELWKLTNNPWGILQTVSRDQIEGLLGRQDPNDQSESFNMAYLAVRGSGALNGVSSLHGKVSRHLFAPLFAHWPEEEVPVGHVTNGVHMPSWQSELADDLWTEACGKACWVRMTDTAERDMLRVSDARLWQMSSQARQSLVEYVHERLARQLRRHGQCNPTCSRLLRQSHSADLPSTMQGEST